MFSHPSMTSNGRRIALVVAVIVLFLLPKRVECGYPGAVCGRAGVLQQLCKTYELEPLGFFLLESVAERDIGFAYTTGEECHGR